MATKGAKENLFSGIEAAFKKAQGNKPEEPKKLEDIDPAKIEAKQNEILKQLALDLADAIHDFVTKGEVRDVQTEISEIFLFSAVFQEISVLTQALVEQAFKSNGIILQGTVTWPSDFSTGNRLVITDESRIYMITKEMMQSAILINVYLVKKANGALVGSGQQSNVVSITYPPS